MDEILKFKVTSAGEFVGLSRGEYDLVEGTDYIVETVEAVEPENTGTPEETVNPSGEGETTDVEETKNDTPSDEGEVEQKKNDDVETTVPEVEEKVSFEPGQVVTFTPNLATLFGASEGTFVEYLPGNAEVKVLVNDEEKTVGVEGIK